MEYYELPVYKEAYALSIWVYKQTPYMGRQYRYTLGERLKDALQGALSAIYKASLGYEKLFYVRQARIFTADVQLCVKLIRDLHLVDEKRLMFLIDKVGSITSQLRSWEFYCIDKKQGKLNSGFSKESGGKVYSTNAKKGKKQAYIKTYYKKKEEPKVQKPSTGESISLFDL